MNYFDISGKNVLVTGSARGIGKHISDSLKELGANVIDTDVAFDVYTSQKWGGDLTDPENMSTLLEMVKSEHGHLDALINNAGITLPSEKKSYPAHNWKKTFSVNLDLPFILTSCAIKEDLLSRNSSVINIASLNASMAFPNNPAYVASKTGLVGLTRSFALDYGHMGIRFNTVSPGYIRTDMTGESWTNLEKRKARQARTALGRWGTPDDLIGLIVLLCSDSSSYITGQDFLIDGGWSIKGL